MSSLKEHRLAAAWEYGTLPLLKLGRYVTFIFQPWARELDRSEFPHKGVPWPVCKGTPSPTDLSEPTLRLLPAVFCPPEYKGHGSLSAPGQGLTGHSARTVPQRPAVVFIFYFNFTYEKLRPRAIREFPRPRTAAEQELQQVWFLPEYTSRLCPPLSLSTYPWRRGTF